MVMLTMMSPSQEQGLESGQLALCLQGLALLLPAVAATGQGSRGN